MNPKNQSESIMTATVRVVRIRKGSDSIKMTIPPSVKGFLDLKPGDDVIMEFVMEDGKKIVKMTKK